MEENEDRLAYEWDDLKARANLRKHGVSVEEAATVFLDEAAVTVYDPDHSSDEDRFLTMGLSLNARLLIVAHTDRGDTIRIISARPATRRESQGYER